MASNHAVLEKYDELIHALQTFNQGILASAEKMSNYGKVCTAAMGSDKLSTNAVTKLNDAVAQYRNVTLKSTDLMKKLVREKENIIGLIRESEMGD